jgi:MFS family permease
MAPYFSFLADIVAPEQRGTAAGMMYLIGGTGIILFVFFGAPLWDTDHRLPFYWAALAVAVSVTIMILGSREKPVMGAVTKEDRSPNIVSSILGNRPLAAFYLAMTFWWSGTWMANFFFVISVKELFSASNHQAFLALFIITVSYVALAFPLGLLGDRIGHRRVTSTGLFFYSIVLFSVPFIPNMTTVYFLMIGAGAGFSVLLSTAYASFLGLIPPNKTARLVGIFMACQNGSLLLANLVGGAVLEHLGASFVFIIAGALIFLSFCVFRFGVRS